MAMKLSAELAERKHQEDLQRIRGFRLLDDDFLTRCFEGNTAFAELVLRIVLEMPDLKVIDVHTQVFVENLLNRSVRLDILATDSKGDRMNIEIQRADKGAGWKRARYNSAIRKARRELLLCARSSRICGSRSVRRAVRKAVQKVIQKVIQRPSGFCRRLLPDRPTRKFRWITPTPILT